MAYNQGNPYPQPQPQAAYGQPQNLSNAGPSAQPGYRSPQQQNYGIAQPSNYGSPQQQNYSGLAPQSNTGYQPSGPYANPPSQPWSVTNPNQRPRPLILALLVFPLQALKIYLLPAPTTFAREKERAGWLALFLLLLLGTVVTGAGAYLWGRIPRLNPGITELSAGRLTPQPLAPGACIFLAISIPLLFLLLEGILRWVAKKFGGTGAFRAQIYTGLLIEAPLFVFIAAAAAILMNNPNYGSSLRLIFAGAAGLLLLYGFLLHIFAVMAVQKISAGKAILSVILILVILIMLVVLLAAIGESSSDGHSGNGSHGQKNSSTKHEHSDSDSSDSGGGEGGESRSRRPSWARYLVCPSCGQRLTLPASMVRANSPCPRCLTPGAR